MAKTRLFLKRTITLIMKSMTINALMIIMKNQNKKPRDKSLYR